MMSCYNVMTFVWRTGLQVTVAKLFFCYLIYTNKSKLWKALIKNKLTTSTLFPQLGSTDVSLWLKERFDSQLAYVSIKILPASSHAR